MPWLQMLMFAVCAGRSAKIADTHAQLHCCAHAVSPSLCMISLCRALQKRIRRPIPFGTLCLCLCLHLPICAAHAGRSGSAAGAQPLPARDPGGVAAGAGTPPGGTHRVEEAAGIAGTCLAGTAAGIGALVEGAGEQATAALAGDLLSPAGAWNKILLHLVLMLRLVCA